MDKYAIKTISLYGFLLLIVTSILSSAVIFYFLYKIYNTNQDLYISEESYNSFLELKLNTEKLLTSTQLEISHGKWKNSVKNFNNKFNNLKQLNFSCVDEIANLWYTCQSDIKEIDLILESEILNSKNLQNKPLLEKKGEMFMAKDTTKLYSLILSLTQKIEYLLQYEQFILKEFEKLTKHNSEIIDKKIKQSIVSSLLFPLIILMVSIFLIIYIFRRIKKIEDELQSTQVKLQNSYDEVKESQLLLNNIINTIQISIFWKDINGIYLGANKNFLRDAGFSNINDLIGKTDLELKWKDNEAKSYMEDDQKVIKSGQSKINFEETQTDSNGNSIYLITSKVPLINIKAEKIGILGSYLDITEKKNTEFELTKKERLLSQQSKMASMGEMLENIAHQWRQPLSVITTGASGIKLNKEYDILTDEMLIDTLDNIVFSANHLSKTIDDFRDFFKADKKKRYFYIDEVIEKALFILLSKFKNRSINVIKNIQQIQVFGLQNELIQVFMNILNNANDVLESVKDTERCIFIDTLAVDDKLKITIKDNAGGVPDDIIDKIFDPYFTTKAESDGTGIGLYMTNEMVTSHMDGKIVVENEQYTYKENSYTGANFIIYLPLQGETEE